MMTATSIGRIAVPYLALTATCGAALVFGIVHMQNEPAPEAKVATAAAAVSPSTPPAQDQVSHALATVQAEAKAVATAPAVPPGADTEDNVPAFDVARIERTGDAVIAGRAAPGATVDHHFALYNDVTFGGKAAQCTAISVPFANGHVWHM